MDFEPTDFETVWKDANCADHPQSHIDAALLAEAVTICARQEVADWDNMAFALARLRDGRYIAIEESEDSSGHGCQCSGTANIYDSLDEAVRLGLGTDARAEYERMRDAGELTHP